MDITSSIAWRRVAWKEECSMSFTERTRKGPHQSDEHWRCFKGNIGKTSDRRGGAHMGIFKRMDTILN